MNLKLWNRGERGFTLIELLVVIAIIGILATLVLVALGTARTRAATARIKSSISQMRAIAAIVDDANNGSYVGPTKCFENPASIDNCNPSTAEIPTEMTTLRDDIVKQKGDLTINSSSTAYCVSATLPSGGAFCADSTGIAREGTSGCGTRTTCP